MSDIILKNKEGIEQTYNGVEALKIKKVGGDFESYVPEPKGQIPITTNGTHDVKGFAEAVVNVPVPDGYVIPEGTKPIYTNGKYDVSEYASVEVDVDSDMPSINEYFPADTWSEGEYFFSGNGTYFTMKYKYKTDNADPQNIEFAAKSLSGFSTKNLADFYAAGVFSGGTKFIVDNTLGYILMNNPVIPVSFDFSELASETIERDVTVISEAIIFGAKTFNRPDVANLETNVTYYIHTEGITTEEIAENSYIIPTYLEWIYEVGTADSGRDRSGELPVKNIFEEDMMDALLENTYYDFIVRYMGVTGKYESGTLYMGTDLFYPEIGYTRAYRKLIEE